MNSLDSSGQITHTCPFYEWHIILSILAAIRSPVEGKSSPLEGKFAKVHLLRYNHSNTVITIEHCYVTLLNIYFGKIYNKYKSCECCYTDVIM